jgi:single-strand DNA-binding protein
MEIIGRFTANAQRKELTDGREVVNFSVAMNDSYKRKGAIEVTKETTFINCSYWICPGIAQHLKKGGIVQVSGSLSAPAYLGIDGEPKASLTFMSITSGCTAVAARKSYRKPYPLTKR